MRAKLRGIAGVAAATATIGATVLTGASAAHADGDYYGCPSGAVCIYVDDASIHLYAQYITNEYWSYGAHNLYNQYGKHWVLNNQTGGASVTLCYGANGTDCTGPTIAAGWWGDDDLGPINSVTLNR
ncbi:MAG TPA: hypothetical protein VFU74_19165 [Actinocrinis sp.]|nr:hypothetical protein [Actinocrinis sp.]